MSYWDRNLSKGERIKNQIEFYFSSRNLPHDKYLSELVNNDPDRYVPLKVISQFNRVKSLSNSIDEIISALEKSYSLELSKDKTRVRRKNALLTSNNNNERGSNKKKKINWDAESHEDFIGVKDLFKTHEKQIEKFRKWAKGGSWKSFHDNHYDWWAFPISNSSNGYGQEYSVTGYDIKQLKKNSTFMKNFRDGQKLIALSWAWDLEKECLVNDIGEDQRWDDWPVRLKKAGQSCLEFEEFDLYFSWKKYAKYLIKMFDNLNKRKSVIRNKKNYMEKKVIGKWEGVEKYYKKKIEEYQKNFSNIQKK